MDGLTPTDLSMKNGLRPHGPFNGTGINSTDPEQTLHVLASNQYLYHLPRNDPLEFEKRKKYHLKTLKFEINVLK